MPGRQTKTRKCLCLGDGSRWDNCVSNGGARDDANRAVKSPDGLTVRGDTLAFVVQITAERLGALR